MLVSPFENITHGLPRIAGEEVVIVHAGLDLFYRDSNSNQSDLLTMAKNRHVGGRERGLLRKARPIDLHGDLDSKYEFRLTIIVEKRTARFTYTGRTLTLRCSSDNAADGLREIFPRKLAVMEAKMATAFQDFLTPEQIKAVAQRYIDRVLGVKD